MVNTCINTGKPMLNMKSRLCMIIAIINYTLLIERSISMERSRSWSTRTADQTTKISYLFVSIMRNGSIVLIRHLSVLQHNFHIYIHISFKIQLWSTLLCLWQFIYSLHWSKLLFTSWKLPASTLIQNGQNLFQWTVIFLITKKVVS